MCGISVHRPFSRFIILMLIAFLVIPTIITVSAEGNSTSIESADSAIKTAFENVLSAENAGGNVTSLIDRLNIAGALLAEAENEQRSDSSINVTTKAMNALIIANQVNDDALSLRNVSLVRSQNNLWLTLTFSLVAVIAFGITLFILWRWFKRSYINKLLGKKPEVVENTT
jgi:hypothetical protein